MRRKKDKAVEDKTAEDKLREASKKSLEDFGILKEMSVCNYVLWLDTKKGKEYLKSIEQPNRNLGDHWTKHEARSKIIMDYAYYKKSLLLQEYD